MIQLMCKLYWMIRGKLLAHRRVVHLHILFVTLFRLYRVALYMLHTQSTLGRQRPKPRLISRVVFARPKWLCILLLRRYYSFILLHHFNHWVVLKLRLIIFLLLQLLALQFIVFKWKCVIPPFLHYVLLQLLHLVKHHLTLLNQKLTFGPVLLNT